MSSLSDDGSKRAGLNDSQIEQPKGGVTLPIVGELTTRDSFCAAAHENASQMS
ncbi:hypothetical protein [Vibrio sp. HB161653]|uniref:hypothetical protein n=1 Tax=Vibrio sp. HB161653 TaxID=3068274 RepID=UPI00273EEA36|nr:hypothetical protein [Vibrio sp. HB161653]MDP5254908.1 hypothetical protein [Vibrio sp. HB161653]